MVAANKEATELRVPFGKGEVITSNILRSPPWLGWPLWNICVTIDHGYVPLVVNTSRSFPHSRFITGFVIRLTRVEQELLTIPEHLSSFPVLVGFVLLDLSFYMYVLSIVVCPFVLFLLAIVLSVLRYTVSDCPFGISKLFLTTNLYESFMYISKITHNKPFWHTVNIIWSFKEKILTIRHIAGNIMTSIKTENTINKIPRQYRYQ